MSDPLHEELRHTVRLCWKSLRGQEVFKAIQVDYDFYNSLDDDLKKEFSPRGQIVAFMSCGASANRLCAILCGNELNDYMTNPNAIGLSETGRLDEALTAMRNNAGYVLVRINVIGGDAGHSYVFLSKHRESGEALNGCIYQTNVGCHKDSAFDLIHWISDKKSEAEVDLPPYLAGLSKGFRLSPGYTYQEKFMLTDKTLKQDELMAMKAKAQSDSDKASFRIQWKEVDQTTASANLLAIRQLAPAETPKSHAFGKVQTSARTILTGG